MNATRTIVPESWEIPAKMKERFGDTAGRQRAMNADGHLLLVLHDPPGPDDQDRKARILWRNPAGTWQCNVDGSVTNLLKKHVSSYTDLAEKLETQLHAASCAADYFNLLQAIAPLQRASRNLHSTLQQAREMIADDHEIIVARDTAGDAERAFELLQIDAKNGLDYTIAQKTELQSEQTFQMAISAHRLNILAALFFPITAISSVFGMNFVSGFEHIPQPILFWGVIAVGFVSGLMLVQSVTTKQSPQPQLAVKTEPPLPHSRQKLRARRT